MIMQGVVAWAGGSLPRPVGTSGPFGAFRGDSWGLSGFEAPPA